MPPQPPELTRWFAEEIQPHEPKLRAWLRLRFPQLQDLDDLLQDTYLRLLQSKRAGRLEHPKAYLYTAAKNAALDRCRRNRIVTFEGIADPGELSVLEDRPDATENSDHDAELVTLADAIDALPERCRQVLILRKHEGLSHREIADRLGISPHTVNAQITAAMIKCRAYFRNRGLIQEKRNETASTHEQ